MVGVWIPVLVCLYSWSELAKADDETPTSSLTPPTEGSASAVGLLRGMTVAHNSDALTKGRTQDYSKVKEDRLASSYPREITYGNSDIKNELTVNLKESSSKKKENNKVAYNVLSTDSLKHNKISLRNTRKLDQNYYKSHFVKPSVKQNNFLASNLEQILPIKNELANNTKFKSELSNINSKNCVSNHLECSKNKKMLIENDRLKYKSQAHMINKMKYMLPVLGVLNGKFKNQSKKSENILDSLNKSHGLTKSNNLKVIEKTKLIENEININKLYGDLKTQLIDIKNEDSPTNNYDPYKKQRKKISNSLVDLEDLETVEENRKYNDTLIRYRRQNNLQFLTDMDNVNNKSKEQHKLCWTETVTITTNIKTNSSENSHEIIKEYGVVWERPVGEEKLSPVSIEKKNNGAKEILSRENINENYLSSNERELLSNSSKKMVKYKIISSNPNQTVKQIETTYCKTGNRIDVETIINNKRKNQRTKFNLLPKEKTIIHSNNDSDIFEPSLESQLDPHVKRTRSINLSEAGDTNLKPNKLFEKVRFDHGTFNIPELSQNQDVTIPKKVREMLGSKSIYTQWHPTEKAKTTASYETGEDSSYYDGDHEDYDYYSDYTDYFDESHFNKTNNSTFFKVENLSQIKNKRGKISKGSVEDIASIEQSSDEAELYESESLKQTENIDHVVLESLTSVKPSQNILTTDYDNHKHLMVLDAQTSPINHKSSQEYYKVKNKTGGVYLETEALTSKIIRETYTEMPIVEGVTLRSDLATNNSKISPTINQINLKLKMSTSTPYVTYTEKNPGIALIDSSKNYDSTIIPNENRSSELTPQSKIPQETSKRGNIFKKAVSPSGRSQDSYSTENTTEKIFKKSTMIFDKVHILSKENSAQQILLESTTEPYTSQLTTIKGNTSIKIILESAMRSYKARDSSTKENTLLGSDNHEISNIASKIYIDKSHKIPTKNVTGEEILQSGLKSDKLNEISLKDNVNEGINIEQITSSYTINGLIATDTSTKLLPLNKYSKILNNNLESENVNGLISLESATYLDKSQEALLTENPIEDILESQTTSDILVDTSTKENKFGHTTLESDKSSDTSNEILAKSSDLSISKIKTGNESVGDSLLYLNNYPHIEISDLEKELRENSTYTSSFESKGSNNEISKFGDFSHTSDTISMEKADEDIVLSQDNIIDFSLSTENNPFDTTSEPDTYNNIYDKETYTESNLTHIPGYKFINSSDEVTYTEKENIYRPGLIEDENNSENIDENYTVEGVDENISLESATFLDKYLDKKGDTTINASPTSSTVSKLATVHYNLTSINDNIMIENIDILKLTTDKPTSNISNSFLGSTNLMENTIEPVERSNIENEMLEFTTLKLLPVELALNGTIDSLFLDSTVMIDRNAEKRIGGTIMENTSNLDTLLKNNEEKLDDNNNTGLLLGLFNDSQDIMKANTKNNKNDKSTLDVNTENLKNKLTTQSKLTGTTQDKLFTYNSSLESSNLLATTIKTSIENLSFNSSLDYTTFQGKMAESGVEIILENVSIESVERSETVKEPTNKSIEVTKMKVMNEELTTETSLINTHLKATHLSRPTKKAKNKISFDNLYSELSTLSAQENSPITNKRPNVKVSFEKIALGTSSSSQNKGESKVETSTENVLRKFSTLLVMNKQPESETSTTNVLSDSTTISRNNIMSLVETTAKSELIELDSISRNTNIVKTETSNENILINPSTSSENTTLSSLETSIANVSIELPTPSRMTDHSPIEALNVNSALEWSSMSGNSIISEVEKSTENVSLEFSTLSGETSISLKYAVTESLTVQSDKLLGNNSIPSVNKLTENVGRESSTLPGVIGQLALKTLNESIYIKSSTLSEEISMAAEETSTDNVLFESTKLSGKADLKSVKISKSNVSMAPFTHSEMTEQSSKEILNAKTIELSRPLGNSIIPPKVETSSENLSSDHALLSVNTVMPLVDILSEAVSINFATLSGNTINSSIETLTENISNDFITLSEYTSMPSVEISYSNMSMEFAIPLGDTDQSEIYNSNIPFKSSKLSGNSIISKGETFTENVTLESVTLSGNISIPAVETFTKNVHSKSTPSGMTELSETLNANLLLESFTISEKSILPEEEISTGYLSLESETLSVTTIMPSVETFKDIISNDFSKPSIITSIPSVEISNSNMSMESVNLLIKTGNSEIETLNPNITFNLFTPSEENVITAVETYTENVSSGSATSSGNISMPSVKPFTETELIVNSTPLGINEQSKINTSIANLLLDYFTVSENSITTNKTPYNENMLLESVTLSGINNLSSLKTFSEIKSIDFATVSKITKIASVETSTKEMLTESYTPSGVTVQSAIETSNANLLLDNFTLSEDSTIHEKETSTGNVLLESATSSGITIMPSVEIFTEKKPIESLTLLGNTNMLPRETLIENMSLNSSTISGITNIPQEETFTVTISNHFTLSDYSSTPLVETPSTNLSIDSPILTGISEQSAINTYNSYASSEYAKREGISILSENTSKANVSFLSSTLSRIASDTSEETSNMNISLESTRQSTISMMPTFEKSSSNVYLEYGTLSGMYGDSSVEISPFGVSLERATHPRTNKNISLETSIVNISLETSTSLGLFEKPPKDLSNQNLSVELVKPTIETEQTLLETSTVNVPLEITTLFGVLNERSKEKSRFNKSLEIVTLIVMSGDKGIETTFTKALDFTKILGTSTDTSLYKSNVNLPVKSIEQLELNTDTLKETSTDNVTLESAKLLGITQEPLEEMSIPTESLELVTVVGIGRIKKPSLDIMIGNESLESDTLHNTTREPLKEKFIPSESLELVTVIGTTIEPSVEITTGNVALESATLLETTREPLKEKYNPTESLELVAMIGTTREPLLDIMTGNVSLESATLLELTREPLKEKSNLTESLELVKMIGMTREPLLDIMTGNLSLESATLLETTREPLKEKYNPTKSLELVAMIGTTKEPLLDIMTGNVSSEFSTLLGMTREPLKEAALIKSVDSYTVSEDVKGPLAHIYSVNEPLDNVKLLSITREPYVESSSSLENEKNSTTTKSELNTDTLFKIKEISTVGNFIFDVSLESSTKYQMVEDSETDTSTLNSLLISEGLPGKTYVSLEENTNENVSLVNPTLLETTSVDIKEAFKKNISLESVNLLITTRNPRIKSTDNAVFLEYSPLLVAMEKSATTEKIFFDYDILPLSIKDPERETNSQNISLEPIAIEDRTKISEIESTAQSVLLELVPLIATTGVSEKIPTTQHVPLEYVPSKIKSGDLQLKPITQILSLETISSTAMTKESEIKTTTENLPLKSATFSTRTGKSNIKHTTQNIPFESSTLLITGGESKTKPYTQNTLWKSSTLGITTDVSEMKNTTQNVLLESVTLVITTEESEIETTNKYSPLESVPLVVKTEISEKQSTTQNVNLDLIPLSNKAENSEIEPATQKSFLKYIPLTFKPRISEMKHTAQNESLKSLPITYTTEIFETELTTETISLKSVTSEITTEESEIETTNQDAPMESVPLKVKTGISEIQSTTQEVHLESNTLLDKEEISEIEPTTQKSFLKYVSLTFTPRVSEIDHKSQNESLRSLPITYTTEILEIEPTTQTVPLEAVTFSATADSSEIEITTETVYLESVSLAITTEESEIETTNKDSTLESVPLVVKTEISEIQSTTQGVQLESITLSDKAEISEIEPTTKKSFLKNLALTFTPIFSEIDHTSQNESLRSLPITYTTEILEQEPTIQTVALELVTLSATTDISELETTTQTVPLELTTLTATTDVSQIDLSIKTVSLESVPLVATTGTSDLETTTQTVTLEPLTLTSMTVISKEEQNTLAVSIESEPLTVTTEVSKIESISTNVSELVSLNAITGISEIEQTTQDESLESFPLSANTGISALEPTTQDISQEWSTLMATTKESEIETTNPNLSFESNNLPVVTKESDIQNGTQNVDFDSSTLSFKTAGSKIKSKTQNIYLESISLSATSGESEINPLSKSVSIESMNLTLPTEETLINFYTQNVYIDAATLSLPTLGPLTEYSTENVYLGSINLPQIKENVSIEISPLIKYSKYDTQIKMTAMSGQEIFPANVLLEYNNLTNTTKESSFKSSIKNIHLESLNSSEQTKDLGIVTSFDNVDLLSENQREIVEESSVGNYLTSIGLEYARIYGNTEVEISTVNESLENSNLPVDWSLETSSLSVEASTGESALETSTLDVLWDSSTLSITGDISVKTTILNKALESTTINGENNSSTGNYNTDDSLEITTLMDMEGKPAVDTYIENDSFEYATIREIKEALTVETHPSSGVYWDSTTFPSTTEYSTVDFYSPNVSMESATFSGITSMALELEPKFEKNNSLSISNNSKQNWELIAETSTKYFKSDNSTLLEIKGSVMKEYIPKNLYLKSKTNSELTKEGFTDNALLNSTNLLLSPEKTKFGYTNKKYTSIYSPFIHSNNQTTTKYDIFRNKNIRTATTAKPVLDKVSESIIYPTINNREVSKFKSFIEQMSSNSEKFQSKISKIKPISDQVSSENSNIKYPSFQETSTVEPIVSQVSLRPYTFHPASKQEIFKGESIDNQILSEIVVTTINPPKTSTNNLKANHTSLESDSISIPIQPERYMVESIIHQESLGSVTVAPLHSKVNTTRIPLFYQVPLNNITNAQKIYMKEPAFDQLSFESEALSVSKIENISQIDKVTGPSLLYGKLILPETILEPIILNEAVNFKNNNIHDIYKMRLVDGQISHKTLKSPNVNYFETSNTGLLNYTKLIESVANPKTNFKETQTVKSTFKQGHIGSVIITTSSNQETSSEESIFDQKYLISANKSSNSTLKPFLAEPTKDKIGLTTYKDYAKLIIFSLNQFYDDSFRNKNITGEYYQEPINFTKGITVGKQKYIPEQINSISTFDQQLEHLNHPFSTNKTTTNVESLSEISHNGSINLPLKLQDYTTFQPFSEELYLAFDNIYIPKITKKHKTKLVVGSQNLSREADDHNKNQLTDHEITLNYTITATNISGSHVKQSLFDQIMSKWENAQSKEVLKGVSNMDTKKQHATVSESNNNIITNRSSINETQNIERIIMSRSRHKEVESTDNNYQEKNEITKLPELIFGLPTIDIDPIYKNTLYSENKYKTLHAPTVKETYTLFLENASQTFNSVKDLSSSLLDQNFQTDNVMSIYGSTKPVSDEVTYTDSREDYFTTTEFAIDMLPTESNEASDEFYDSTTEDSYGYTFIEDFTTTEISTYDHESTEINFDESISEENTNTDFTTTEYSTDSEEDTNEITNQRMIVSRYFQHSYKPSSFLNTSLLENSTGNENLNEIKTKEDEIKTDEKDNMEMTATELYKGVDEELGKEESVTRSTGHMGWNSNQVEMNEDTNDREWTTTLDSVWNIWTKKPKYNNTRLSDEITTDVEIIYPKDNIEKSQSIEMTTLEITPAKSKLSEKIIISKISLNNDVNNNKTHKEYNDSTEQSSEEEISTENLKKLETSIFESNIGIGSLKLYMSNSEKYSDTTEDKNLVGFEKQTIDFKKPKAKAILIENKYEEKPSTLKYSEERIIKGGKIQSDVPENIPLASHLHFNNTTKEINNISQFNNKTSYFNHLNFTIEPVERSTWIKHKSIFSDYTEPRQITEAILNKKLSDFGEFRGLQSTNMSTSYRIKSSPIFPNTELEYRLTKEKNTDSKYPYSNIDTIPYFSKTENTSVSFLSEQNTKMSNSRKHNILKGHRAHIYQNIPKSLQTGYAIREMNNYETTPLTKLYNRGENKFNLTKETLENIERENYSKNGPEILHKEPIVISSKNYDKFSLLLTNQYKIDPNESSFSRDEYEKKTIPVSTTFYGSVEVNANTPCTDALNINHNIESPTIGTRNFGYNLKLNENERNPLQERIYTAGGQLETLNSKTNLTLQQLIQIFHSKSDIDKEILRQNNLTNNLTVKQILNILYSKVKETAQNQQKYIENKTKEGTPMFDHSSISKARSEISIKQTMQGSKNHFVEIYNDTTRKKQPISELVNCIQKGKSDFDYDYNFDQYDESSSDKSHQNNREEQTESVILFRVPPEDMTKLERDKQHFKNTNDNTADDISISQFYDDDRVLNYDSEYGIYDDESYEEDYRRMADTSNIEGYKIGNRRNMNDYPIIMSDKIIMPKPFDTNLGQILEDNEHSIGSISDVSDPTMFYYHTTYKDKNQRFTPYDYARYFEIGPQKYTHGISSNARYNRYENRGIKKINVPNNFRSNLEKYFGREKYRNNSLRRRPIRRKPQATTFSKTNILSQNMKYAPSEENTERIPRVTLTKLKRRNPTFIRMPYLLLRNEYLRATEKPHTHWKNQLLYKHEPDF